jgi:hypothetical protein
MASSLAPIGSPRVEKDSDVDALAEEKNRKKGPEDRNLQPTGIIRVLGWKKLMWQNVLIKMKNIFTDKESLPIQ